jgi:D-lyxose ketol-isomerase
LYIEDKTANYRRNTGVKRSEINSAIEYAVERFREHKIALPSFAYWKPEQWRKMSGKARRIILACMGWDVTDLGLGKFEEIGGVLFTVRNGVPGTGNQGVSTGVPYCEKYIVLMEGQCLPLHMHWSKTEDIINRAGGVLMMELYNSTEDEEVDSSSSVLFVCDGLEREIEAGEPFELLPGESITLIPGLYHRFWAKKGQGCLICGEVSSVNDDNTDNRFAEPSSRFSEILEDEEPRWLLCNEYPAVDERTSV